MNLKLHLHLHLLRFITVASLGIGLVAFGGGALAQESVAPVINADGSSGASHAGLNPAVDADGPTLVYGDIPGGTVISPSPEGSAPVSKDVVYAPPPGTTGDITATNGDAAALGPTGDASAAPGSVTGGSGTALLGPDGTYSVTEISPSDVTVGDSGALAPAPVSEPVPVTEPAPEAVAAPVENIEPVVADTDGDGVADVDEANLYGTDSLVWDTDGDRLSDGEELFANGTDSLLWDTDADGFSDGEEAASGTDPLDSAGVPVSVQEASPGPEGVASETASLDGDVDRLADADEAALGTDPTSPDTDSDGYYDGDEMNLGTDPLDATSFPI
jgi:hypothetical protein